MYIPYITQDPIHIGKDNYLNSHESKLHKDDSYEITCTVLGRLLGRLLGRYLVGTWSVLGGIIPPSIKGGGM